MKDNCFCQVICKYTLTFASQEIKTLVAHKALQLSTSKVNIKTLGKFDIVSITWFQHHYTPLLISILCTYTNIRSVNNNKELYSNDEKDKSELGNILPQKILVNQKVT